MLVQQPPDLDTACSLALLQEEVADGELPYGRSTNRNPTSFTRAATPSFFSRPATPTTIYEDQRGTDAARAQSEASKVAALRRFRRAKGLCFKCRERWGKDHVCPPTIQMHVVGELLAMFAQDDVHTESPPASPKSEEENMCTILRQANDGSPDPGVLQLHAWLQGHEILMLVDSGSSTSFVDSALAAKLTGAAPLSRPCKVRVGNGATIPCSHCIPECQWITQRHEFTTYFKILKLGSYNAILGMGWLRKHSPMHINWIDQYLTVTTSASQLRLSAISSDQTQCSVISAPELLKACKQASVAHIVHLNSLDSNGSTDTPMPAEVLRLLEQYADVFEDPRTLPPRRKCDQKIPLMPGTQPVNPRPYRYKPELKTEIERQIQELLDAGVIQKSSSPFSSPALLVKKKDDMWRLCIDYRCLNSMTVVSKYPVPIINELLDELAGAKWFSKLDLRTGFHQIRMAEGEEYKTTFQTYSGHWEYHAMPFGVAGGPATFNGAITTTLKPVLRDCAISFFDDILIFSKTLSEHLQHIAQVLQLLRNDHWQVKQSKCSFAQQ